MAAPAWSRDINQRLLERYGFSGQAGPQYGGQGEKFLDSLSLKDQFAYVSERRGYKGEEGYNRPGLNENVSKALAGGTGGNSLNDFFAKFLPSLMSGLNPSETAPNKNDLFRVIKTETDLEAKRKGRKSTITSNFQELEKPTTGTTKYKELLGG